jgi:hypothetical protein
MVKFDEIQKNRDIPNAQMTKDSRIRLPVKTATDMLNFPDKLKLRKLILMLVIKF